jgi:hypothetical protein
MSIVDHLPSMTGVVETLGAQNKAIFGGALVASQATDTLLYAALAWAGLGTMPTEVEIVEAIRTLYWALLTWIGIYLIPNLPRTGVTPALPQ